MAQGLEYRESPEAVSTDFTAGLTENPCQFNPRHFKVEKIGYLGYEAPTVITRIELPPSPPYGGWLIAFKKESFLPFTEEKLTSSPPFQPYISPDTYLPEITWRAILLGAVLSIIFGATSAYLGLRVGLTVSASIPSAVIALMLFRSRTHS
ncbi:MAG: hypothetical protein DMG05_09780, partial [Acidobacteria bacterium]